MPKKEDLGRVSGQIKHVLDGMHHSSQITVSMGGAISDMRSSFQSFGIGLILAIVLVYLILMAQFASFSDPFIICWRFLRASGVILFLMATGTTLNVMSLMGVVMTTGIAVSNSILIVQFVGTLRAHGRPLKQALAEACEVRLRPF